LSPEKLQRLEKAEQETAPKRYQATVDAYGKGLVDNKVQIEALQKSCEARKAGNVPPTKKTNDELLNDLGRMETQLQQLDESIEQITPEVSQLEEQYRALQEKQARGRSSRAAKLAQGRK
jgi:predicted nuclease with TOPRIM domain